MAWAGVRARLLSMFVTCLLQVTIKLLIGFISISPTRKTRAKASHSENHSTSVFKHVFPFDFGILTMWLFGVTCELQTIDFVAS